MNISAGKHRRKESTGIRIKRLSRSQWNRLEALSHDDPNPQTLSVSISGSFLLCPSLSPSSDLFGYNQHVARSKRKTNTTNSACTEGTVREPADIRVTGREMDRYWAEKLTVRWQTGNVPMPVWSPGAAGVIGVARVGRLGVHPGAVQSWRLARGMRRDSSCGGEGKLAAVLRRRRSGLL